MFPFTRRIRLAGFSALAVLLSLGTPVPAQHVRHDARSPEGHKMLMIYAKAVAKMQATKQGDPDSWTFQWYTHSVKGSTTKAAALNEIYGPNPSPFKMLAQEMWDTCQAHHPPGHEDDFLSWHRMFVYYFEEIIRDVSGEKSFTLPYWNYSVAGPNHGVIPPEFTMKNDPLFKALYVENRNPGVNQGHPIDQGQPPGLLNPVELAECFYEPTGSHPGFCGRLDGGLHAVVHVLVGDGQNMGTVPWAARDPIFWLHHCNIDRLWASWNDAGRTNPSTMGSFTFAEKKKKVVATDTDWMVAQTEKHGYCYDHLEPVPSCPTTRPALLALAQKQLQVAAVKSKEIKLGTGPTKVTLEPLPPQAGAQALDFHERVKALPAEKHVLLLVKNLRADEQPGVLYHLYMQLPQGATGDKAQPYYVGTVNFFNAVHHGTGHEKEAAKASDRFYQFDITDLAKTLQGKGALPASPTLTIVPSGKPSDKANAVIGQITVVEE
jgi:tyrosinase